MKTMKTQMMEMTEKEEVRWNKGKIQKTEWQIREERQRQCKCLITIISTPMARMMKGLSNLQMMKKIHEWNYEVIKKRGDDGLLQIMKRITEIESRSRRPMTPTLHP